MTDILTTPAMRRRLNETYATAVRNIRRGGPRTINPEAPRRRATHDELQVYLQNRWGATYDLAYARYEIRTPVRTPRNHGYHPLNENSPLPMPHERTFREARVTVAQETLARCHSVEELDAIVRDNIARASREEPPIPGAQVTHSACAGFRCNAACVAGSTYCLECNNS